MKNTVEYNTTGFPIDIVPNIVHFVLFKVHEIEFAHFMSMVSLLRNHRPDLIYIHCDCTELYGDNWHRVQAIANRTGTRLTVRPIEMPTQVFGKNLSEGWRLWHASDVTRIQVLREFGGIYLDRDVYVIKPFNEFFKYEMTIDFQSKNELGNQVLIAHKKARFLRLYYESYREYDANAWYKNSGILPVLNIINKQPHLIHRMDGQFGVRPNVCHMLYTEGNELSSIGWCLDDKKPPTCLGFIFGHHMSGPSDHHKT
ncbi:unnamed protein product [Oppiella nova]|uniref:Glycosyltransferase n=1 Tax=Oppiella nova TaxID=334625 RepID=A0A7R9MDB3_9ACAR|nr:unnamed protein product [Oppiella nova]CAG2175252.1 unnamed protein product [Oppiella nova]